MKHTIKIATILFLSLTFSGCIGESPTPPSTKVPMVDNRKPTVNIKFDKLENLTQENSVWNGVSFSIVEAQQESRCIRKENYIRFLMDSGFKVVLENEKADYTVEQRLLSCGHEQNSLNKKNIPLNEKSIFKDLKSVVEKMPASHPEYSMVEIMKQIATRMVSEMENNKVEAFADFYSDNWTRIALKKKVSTPLSWNDVRRLEYKYLKNNNNKIFPIAEVSHLEDAEKVYKTKYLMILSGYGFDMSTVPLTYTEGISNLNTFGKGATIASGSSSGSGTLGATVMGISVLKGLLSKSSIDIRVLSKNTIINNKNGKKITWEGSSWHIQKLDWDRLK